MAGIQAFFHALLLVFGVVSISSEVGSSVAPLHLKSEKYRVPGHYIVVLKDDVPDVDTFARSFETSVLRGASEGKIHHTYQHAIKGFSAQLSVNALKKLRDSEHVKYVEENGIVHTSTVSSWGLGRVDQRDLPLDTNTPNFIGNGKDTHLYIIDTGTAKTHNEFNGRFSDIGFDSIEDSIGLDCNGHGTHCGGTAAGATYGVATQATVHSVRVLNCGGTGTNTGVIAGMDWVAQNAEKPAVASMSLGGSFSQADNDAVQGMVNAGVVVSVAAGNEDVDACDVSPASAPAAITVGATDNSDTRADFSNYGVCVDIFAPGVSITSSWINSDSDTTTISGTSMACPHVSGAAAALLSVDSTLTPTEVTDQLLRASTPNKVSDPSSVNRLLYIGEDTCMTRCGDAQDGSQSCQCDSACSSRSDCCSDYDFLCGANAPSCKDRCDSTDASYPCPCDQDCVSRGDCCPDFSMECETSGTPIDSGCDEVVTAEGYISSPNWPNRYPNNEKVHTCITAPVGENVVITFSSFNVEYEYSCYYDMLRIYDGSDASSSLFGSFCGNDFEYLYPEYIQSTEESLYLVFQSDGSERRGGYEAEVNFLGSGTCDATLDYEDVISSPNYAGHYLNDQECHTLITASAGEIISLTFTNFDIEYDDYCYFDSLSIYDGSDDASPLIGEYCGASWSWWSIPDTIVSTGSSLYLVFKSDESVVQAGYQADVQFTLGAPKDMIKPTIGPAMSTPVSLLKPTVGIPKRQVGQNVKHGKAKRKPNPMKHAEI